MFNDGFERSNSDAGHASDVIGDPTIRNPNQKMSHVTSKHGTRDSNYDYHRRIVNKIQFFPNKLRRYVAVAVE